MADKTGYDYKKLLLSLAGLVILFVILVLVNILVSFASLRWDVTDGKMYSLSDGTRKVLSDLPTPVTVKFFYSRSQPQTPMDIKLYAGRVMDLLTEYRHASQGRIRIESYDPGPDSDEEEWAQRYGIRPVGLPDGQPLYCGLVFLSADQEAVLPFLDPTKEDRLEYEMTRIISSLQTSERPVIGILSALPVFGAASPQRPGQPHMPPWLFVEELRKSYEVKPVLQDATRIDPSVDLLMVIYPRDLSPRMQYAVDQYVAGGGNAMIFVDPMSLSDPARQSQQFMGAASAGLPELFAAWGVSMDLSQAVADMAQPTRVRSASNQPEENPMMISVRGASFNPEDIITSGLDTMLFPVAGTLVRLPDFEGEWEVLIQSSDNAGLTSAFHIYGEATEIRKSFAPAGEPLVLAVRVRGTFKSAFPDGPPEPEEGETEIRDLSAEHLVEGKKEAALILVSDADLLADPFFVRRGSFLGFAVSEMFNDNLNFVANAAEILTGSDHLIGLRTRTKMERPFTAVLELKQRAQERWLSKEMELVRRVEETNEKLRQLEAQKDASQMTLVSPEQEAEIVRFRAEKDKISGELREVRKNLRADIDSLGTTLKVINIFLVPFLVSLAGIGFALYRQRKRKRR